MPRNLMYFDSGEEYKVVSIGPDLTPLNEDHFVIEVPEGIEDWRFSVDEDGELVIAYEGQSTEEALASLLADQQAALAAREAEVIASRGE